MGHRFPLFLWNLDSDNLVPWEKTEPHTHTRDPLFLTLQFWPHNLRKLRLRKNPIYIYTIPYMYGHIHIIPINIHTYIHINYNTYTNDWLIDWLIVCICIVLHLRRFLILLFSLCIYAAFLYYYLVLHLRCFLYHYLIDSLYTRTLLLDPHYAKHLNFALAAPK